MMKVRNDTNWIIRLCSIAIVPRFCLIFDSLNPTRVGRMRRTWSRLEFRDGSGVKDHKIYHKNWKVIESSSAPANGELAGGNKTSSLGTLSAHPNFCADVVDATSSSFPHWSRLPDIFDRLFRSFEIDTKYKYGTYQIVQRAIDGTI